MNKAKITISIDAKLLKRLDSLSQLRRQARSRTIEQFLKNQINDEETHTQKLANPQTNAIVEQLINNPDIINRIAIMISEEIVTNTK